MDVTGRNNASCTEEMSHLWTLVPAQPRVALSYLEESPGRHRPRQVRSVARRASVLNRAG